MDLAGYVINAVLIEGRSVKEVCQAHGISRSWLYELIAPYREQGEDGLRPQSKPSMSVSVPTAATGDGVAFDDDSPSGEGGYVLAGHPAPSDGWSRPRLHHTKGRRRIRQSLDDEEDSAAQVPSASGAVAPSVAGLPSAESDSAL